MDFNVFANFSFVSSGLELRKSSQEMTGSVLKSAIGKKSGHSDHSVAEDDAMQESKRTKMLRAVKKEEVLAEHGVEEQEIGSAGVRRSKRNASLATQGSKGPQEAKKLRPEQTVKLALDIEDVGLVKTEIPDSYQEIPRRPRGQSAELGCVKSPPSWEAVVDQIRNMRMDKTAPVDLFGTHQVCFIRNLESKVVFGIGDLDLCVEDNERILMDMLATILSSTDLRWLIRNFQLIDCSASKETQQFHALVAGMISSQTRDAVTAAAMGRLHAVAGGLTVDHIADDTITTDALAELLKPVGFYRQKAKNLKSIAQILSKPPHNGLVPSNLEDLMKLPGVGPKVALLVLCVAFGRSEEGMVVDTNVRRVCCRLGWVPQDSSPEQTRKQLEQWLPKSLWGELSFLFVGFGQQVCKPVSPNCAACTANNLCPSAFFKKGRNGGRNNMS